MRTPALAAIVGACAAALFAPAAGASQLVDRNAAGVRLEVDRGARALLTYRARGSLRHVLAWGAVDAVTPPPDRPQVRFSLDYSGGWGAARRDVWRTFENACVPFRPALAWLVAACRAPDGSAWAVQAWQRGLPNYGARPTPRQAAWELRLSHWTSELPRLEVRLGWTFRRYQQLYGRLTYRGRPVHGFRTTSSGAPLDTFGRNVYVDTLNSRYGAGWRRENSFITHVGTGGFCYGFYPHGVRPSGRGERYRATVIGPGVLPDTYWQGEAPPAYDEAYDLLANNDMSLLLAGDRFCRPL